MNAMLIAAAIFLLVSVLLIGKGIKQSGGAGAAWVLAGFPFFLAAALTWMSSWDAESWAAFEVGFKTFFGAR